MNPKILRIVRSRAFSVLSLALGIVIVFPLFYALMCGFKDDATFDAYPPTIFPQSFTYLENYRQVLFDSLVPRFMWNSLVIAVTVTVVRLLISTLAAYAFAFFRFPGKKFLFFLIIGTMMIPAETVLITNYLTISRLELLNTYLGVMAVYFVSATQVFMFRQNFKTISSSLRDAAFLDGCGDIQFYLCICLPVSKAIITSLGLNSFVAVWNTYLWPLLVTSKPEMRTVQVGITLLSADESGIKAPIFAAIAIILLPSVLIFAFFQRNIVRGITGGSVKG